MSMNMDFQNWPKWIKDMLPEDLYNAYGNVRKHDVKASGRKSSIDKDNVNDLSYYYYNLKKDRIYREIKGTDKSPIRYAYEKSSVKCFCFLYKDDNHFGSEAKMLKKFYDTYKDNEDYIWLKYFCILNATPNMFKPDEIYDFILNTSSPYENLLIVANRYRNIRATEVLKTRNNKDKDKDIEIYNSLDRNQKIQFLRIVRMEKLQFEIEDAVKSEPDLEINFAYFFSTLQVIKTALKYNLIDEFTQFVDDHKKLFENFCNFKMIHPKYRKLYPIAFKDESRKKVEEAKENYSNLYFFETDISNYVTDKLVPNKCWDEIIYLVEKGFELSSWQVEDILKTLNYQMIDFIKKNVPKKDLERAQDRLFSQGHECVEELFKLGYHPSTVAVGWALVNRKSRYGKNFDLIERFVPSNEKLDCMKYCFAENDIDRLPEFLSKYSDRFESMDIDSFNLSRKNGNYPRLCEILGVEYVKSESESEPEPESSSSSHKHKRYKSRSKPPKKPQRVMTRPYQVCSACSEANICVVCRKSYKFHCGLSSRVCPSHSQKLCSKCPICNQRSISHIGMLCNDCVRNYHFIGCKCYQCILNSKK